MSSKNPDSISDFKIFSSLRYDPKIVSNISLRNPLLCQNGADGLYMLSYHRDRILEAAKYFKWQAVIEHLENEAGLQKFRDDIIVDVKSYLKEHSLGLSALKVKTTISQSGNLSIDINPIPEVSEEALYPTKLETNEKIENFVPSSKTGGALILGRSDHLISQSHKRDTDEFWGLYLDTSATISSPFTSFKTTSRSMYDDARARAGIKSFKEKAEVVLYNSKGELTEGSLTSVYFFRDGEWLTPAAESGGQAGTTRRWLIERDLCREAVIRKETLVDGERCYISNGVRGTIPCLFKSASRH